jgi:hypothetical protein
MRKTVTVALATYLFSFVGLYGQSSPCDLAPQNSAINQADVDAAVGMVIGQQPCTANINGSNVCTVVTVQRVVNAALGGACVTDTRTVTLNWTASVSSGVVGYNVYRSTVSGGSYSKINGTPVAATTYADTTVQTGQTYYYVARAVGSTGLESVNSNQATAVVQ